MVKIFVGNLSPDAEREEIEALFTRYGAVTECAKYQYYAFVHMEDGAAAARAIAALHLSVLHGQPVTVQRSLARLHGTNAEQRSPAMKLHVANAEQRSPAMKLHVANAEQRSPAMKLCSPTTKLHVANVERGCDRELRVLFERHGTVAECAVVKDFAFVHMADADQAADAIAALDGAEFCGKRIRVQLSKSRARGGPRGGAYLHPHHHHQGAELSSYSAPPPRPAAYPECLNGERGDVYGAALQAENYKYMTGTYGAPYGPTSVDLPLPSSSGVAPPPLPLRLYESRAPPPAAPPASRYGRDRSPYRGAPPPLPAPVAVTGYDNGYANGYANGYSYQNQASLGLSLPLADLFTESVAPLPQPRYASYWEQRK